MVILDYLMAFAIIMDEVNRRKYPAIGQSKHDWRGKLKPCTRGLIPSEYTKSWSIGQCCKNNSIFLMLFNDFLAVDDIGALVQVPLFFSSLLAKDGFDRGWWPLTYNKIKNNIKVLIKMFGTHTHSASGMIKRRKCRVYTPEDLVVTRVLVRS